VRRCGDQRVDVRAIAGYCPRPIRQQGVVTRAVVAGRHPEGGGIRGGLSKVLVGELAPPRRHRDERRHTRRSSVGLIRIADPGQGTLRCLGVREHVDQRRLVGDQGDHVVGMIGDERERGHRAPAAREHLGGTSAKGINQGVHVVGLDRGRIVDTAVSARAAAQAARVIRDHRSVRKMGRERGEPLGGHRLTDHDQRRSSVGGGQRAVDVVDDVGFGGLERACCPHVSLDPVRDQNSSGRLLSTIEGSAGVRSAGKSRCRRTR
jgi:hypothetical protein